MRISRTVNFNAYMRTIAELQQFGIEEKDLPPRFYEMHWSERRRYIMERFALYVCPRCRRVVDPADKHTRKHLCKRCGDNTSHHLTYINDDEALLGAHPRAIVGVSKPDPSTIAAARPSAVQAVMDRLRPGLRPKSDE